MKLIKTIILVFAAILLMVSNKSGGETMNYRILTPEEERIIVNKGTERPFTGKYLKNKESGLYCCKRCGLELYRSDNKFDSGCGWPSFDNEIKDAVKRVPDSDGMRTEIVCSRCDAHLGHVFTGEGFTPANTRHCVNSISLIFRSNESDAAGKSELAVFAAGCFWGVEHLMKNLPGVRSAISGYTGGRIADPDYRSVCTGKTGHYEAVEIEYDPHIIQFEELVKVFFEIHDFGQEDGQGPDIGEQYRSAIFYRDESQKKVAESIIEMLKNMGKTVATQLLPATTFYRAEDYHQNYYERTGKNPYCHVRRKIF